jgi:hypothetical protein
MDKMDITICGGPVVTATPIPTPTPTPTPTPEPTEPGATPTPYTGSGKPRVIVTSDIGGSDPDDFQSMVHYMVCTDVFDTEGIISSPHSTGRKEAILEVIDRYEQDYGNLITHSPDYPTPDELRAITKNGAPGSETGGSGQRLGDPTEGSQLIVEAALRDDPRPLFVLVWGSIGDVAQAVHDVPQIKSKIRVYFIGGPNKKGCSDTYNYLEVNHRDLWIIENNSTYRGFFNGGNMSGSYSNSGFVSSHVRGHGALGDYFNSKKSEIKMGDSPSVTYVMNNNLDDPTQPGWGGAFIRAWERSHLIEYEVKSGGVMERFGIYELQIPVGDVVDPWAKIAVANQNRPGFVVDGIMQLRCSSKNAETLSYTTTSNIPALDGKSGSFTARQPSPDQANHPSPLYANWWTDNPDPALEEGGEQGAKTVNQWRTQFLDDFEARMDRAQAPK